jgi:rare lipoprotein A
VGPAPDARPTAVASDEAPPALGHARSYYLQAGAFADPHNAQAVLARMRDGGVPGAFVLDPPAGSTLYRVRMGPLSSVDDLDHWTQRLAELGFGDARVIATE